MTYVLAGLCLALLALHLWERYQAIVREDAWRLERAALLTRIQHPEIIVGQAEEQVVPDEQLRDIEADDIDLVGAIVTENGTGDGSGD